MGWSTSFTARALLGFGAALLTTVTLVVSGMLLFKATAARQVDELTEFSSTLLVANRLESAVRDMTVGAYGFLLTSDGAYASKFHQASQQFDRSMKDFQANASPWSSKVAAGSLARSASELRMSFNDVLDEEPPLGAPTKAAKRRMAPVLAQDRRVVLSAQALARDLTATLAETRAAAQRQHARLSRMIMALTGAAVLVTTLLAFGTIRRLCRLYDNEKQATRKAREAMAARDQVLAIVAHDLRNPLAALAMKAKLIEVGSTDDESRRHAVAMDAIAKRASSLIQSLLDAAAVDAGALAIKPVSCPVIPLVEEVAEVFAPLAARRSIKLEYQLVDSAPVAYCDRDRIHQALGNLLSNALDFTPKGGKVTIRVDTLDGKGWTRVTVSDTGSGISAEKLGQIFDRYWHGEIAGRKGTGLGLFIVEADPAGARRPDLGREHRRPGQQLSHGAPRRQAARGPRDLRGLRGLDGPPRLPAAGRLRPPLTAGSLAVTSHHTSSSSSIRQTSPTDITAAVSRS